MSKSNWLASFSQAWDILLDYPLPLHTEESEDVSILYFPIVGAVLGIALYVVAKIATLLLGALGAAILIGGVFPLLYEVITSGRALKSLTLLFYLKRSGVPNSSAIQQLGEEFRLTEELFSLMFVFTMLIIRMVTIGVLVYKGFMFWIPIVLLVSYATQGYLALFNELSTGEPVLEENEHNLKPMLLFTLGLSALFGLGHGLLTLAIVLCVTAFLIKHYGEKLTTEWNGISPELIGVISYIIQMIYLFLGFAIFVR